MTDVDMFQFIEKGMQGRISVFGKTMENIRKRVKVK